MFTPPLEAEEESGDLIEPENNTTNNKAKVFARRDLAIALPRGCVLVRTARLFYPWGEEQGQEDRREVVAKGPGGAERTQHHYLECLAPEGCARCYHLR